MVQVDCYDSLREIKILAYELDSGEEWVAFKKLIKAMVEAWKVGRELA